MLRLRRGPGGPASRLRWRGAAGGWHPLLVPDERRSARRRRCALV